MYEDILEDSWVYQEILERGQKQGLELGQKQGLELGKKQGKLEALQQVLIGIIQTRFPEMARQASRQVAQASNREQLQQAVIEVSIAHDASEVARVLSSLSTAEKL
jgi:predicted transposase YdaD